MKIEVSIAPKKKILSIGGGCAANWFFWMLGISEKSPVDNTLYKNGALPTCLFDNTFFNAVKNHAFTSSNAPLVENNEFCPNKFVILKMETGDVWFPHITFSEKFLIELNSRIENFKKLINCNDTIFVLVNREECPYSQTDTKCILESYNFSPDNLIIFNLASQEENNFLKYGIPSVDIPNYLIPNFYSVNEVTKSEFINIWEKFCVSFPKMAGKIDKIQPHVW